MAKAILIDTSKCTACRGCQLACKQWNDLPAEETQNWGSYQNPRYLSASTWKLVTFREVDDGDKIRWLFVPMQCLHCTDANCVSACPTSAAHYRDGAVLIDQDLCIDCGRCVEACPFNVPASTRALNGNSTVQKCNFCIDRLSNDMPPACAKTCTTAAYSFGERAEMVSKGRARVQELKEEGFQDAYLYGENELGGLHVMFALADRPAVYGLPEEPQAVTMNVIGRWLSGVLAAGTLAALPFWLLTKRKRELAKERDK